MFKGRTSVTLNSFDVWWSLSWGAVAIRYTTIAVRGEFESYLERLLTHTFLAL